MDAWLKSTSNSRPAPKKKASGGLDYAKFDKIIDSDDDDDAKKQRNASSSRPGPASSGGGGRDIDENGPLGKMPPHLRALYAKVTMAKERGDQRMQAAATMELEAALRAMPSAFQQALQPYQETSKIQNIRDSLESVPPTAMKSALDEQLSQLEIAQQQLQNMTDNPEDVPAWLASLGISQAAIEEAENASDPNEAMSALAKQALHKSLQKAPLPPPTSTSTKPSTTKSATTESASTKPSTKTAFSSSSSSRAAAAAAATSTDTPEMARARAALEASRAKMLAAQAEVAEHAAAAEKAAAAAAKAKAAVDEAELKKHEQGELVDASVEGARAELMAQAKAGQEAAAKRLAVVRDLRERGNVAMRQDDPTAARSFYSQVCERMGRRCLPLFSGPPLVLTATTDPCTRAPCDSQALDVPAVPADERAKTLGNRAACLLALQRADLALVDAEEAVELTPDAGKPWCVQDGPSPSLLTTRTHTLWHPPCTDDPCTALVRPTPHAQVPPRLPAARREALLGREALARGGGAAAAKRGGGLHTAGADGRRGGDPSGGAAASHRRGCLCGCCHKRRRRT